jgi:hypothetical protein
LAALSPADVDVIRKARRTMRKREDLESAIGRVLRERGGGYDRYIAVVGALREEARRQGISLDEAARKLTAPG